MTLETGGRFRMKFSVLVSLLVLTGVVSLHITSLKHKEHRVGRPCWFAAAILAAVSQFSGCVPCVPIPARKEVKSPNGAGTPDLAFVTPGTSGQEVEQRLSSINTHVKTPGLLWGRFLTSKWRAVGVGIGARDWGNDNLLAYYGADGTVISTQIVPEGKLDALLANRITTHPRTVRLPMRFTARSGGSFHGELVLDAATVTFTLFKPEPIVKTKAAYDFTTYAQRLDSMKKVLAASPLFVAAPARILHVMPAYPQPESLGAVRYLNMMATDGKKYSVIIALTPDQLLDLLQYVQHQTPSVTLGKNFSP
jgi:hypothetical protein